MIIHENSKFEKKLEKELTFDTADQFVGQFLYARDQNNKVRIEPTSDQDFETLPIMSHFSWFVNQIFYILESFEYEADELDEKKWAIVVKRDCI